MFNKKFQVLLSGWMEDYLKYVAEKYDVSMSSAIRAFLCLGIIKNISMLFPEYKSDLDEKEFKKFVTQARQNVLEEEDSYDMMSKLLFEARKAVDYRFSKSKEKKKHF